MKLNTNIKINPLAEGSNILKAWFSVITGAMISRPVSINLLPSMRCNSKCIMCDSWRTEEKNQRIDLVMYRKLADDMKEMGIPYVTIGGGEPLLNKDCISLIKIFSNRQIAVQLTTNGFNMDSSRLEELLEAGLSRLTFSIDSHHPETYKAIRGVDWCEKIISNMENCINEAGTKISIETNSVITARNIDTFVDTMKYFIKNGVNKVCFSAVTISADNYLIQNTKENLIRINPETANKLVKELLDLKDKYPKKISASRQFIKGISKYISDPYTAVYPCYAGYLTLDVLYDGEVFSCGNLPSLGNLRNSSISEIWFSKEAMKSRKAMASKKCPSCYTSCKIELGILGSPLRGIPYCIEKIKELI
jgi:Fe-coproporphyrin III synthase